MRRSRRRRPSRRRSGGPTCAAPSGGRCAPAASRSGRVHRGRRSGPGGSSCSATCRGRWSPTPGRWCGSSTPPWSAGPQVEAFALGTRLTRITRELLSRDPDAALAAAGPRSPDWSGGTRLGEGLRASTTSGACGAWPGARCVVILSDGWDRGDPALLAEQMARLHRVATGWCGSTRSRRRRATRRWRPGMAAALPYVDEFVEGHSLASLQELAEVIAR